MSRLDSKTRAIVQDPVKRRAWVKYQIQLQGRSMAQIAADLGVDRRTLYQTFTRPYPRMEAVIADAVGLTPQQLWPERYDADGLPARPMGRPRKKSTATKDNTSRQGRNVNEREVA